MIKENSSSRYRRYEIYTEPRKLISSYALESSASHIAAAKLVMGKQNMAAQGGLKLEQLEAHKREVVSAQVMESLYIGTLREILRWEQTRSSDPQESCIPFVDVASDALLETVLESQVKISNKLFPNDDRPRADIREATMGDDDRSLVITYFRNYIRRLLMFNLTQYADIEIGSDRHFQSLAQRRLYFFNTIYPCESAVDRLEVSLLEKPMREASLEEAVAYTEMVADRIRSLSFVSGLGFPKLRKRMILCGTENLHDDLNDDEDTIFLNSDSPGRNVLTRLARIEEGIRTPLSSISKDLIEVATYVFSADSLVHRTARWRRSLNFIIPVRNLKRWNDVASDLSLATSFLSGDHVSFEFVQKEKKEDGKAFQQRPISGDCVCLLSGGLDSFAGALGLVIDGRQPVLVGHFKQGHIAKRQGLLAKTLQEYATKERGLKNITALRLDNGLARGREKYGFKGKLEYTQRLRSFLFLSLATAVAEGLGLYEIFIPENGILAINVPLAACRTGSRSSRSAHPRFLWYFEKIVNQLFGQEYKIRNPFIFKTKAEVLEVFKGTGIEGELANSITCSRYSYGVMMDKRRGKRVCTHCGACFACLIRRAAMIKADLADQDAEYIIRSFREFIPLREGERLGLIHLVDFCNAISDASDDQILLRHPQLFLPNQYLPDAEKGSIPAIEVARMYRRFANEIIEVVNENARVDDRHPSPLLEVCGMVGHD